MPRLTLPWERRPRALEGIPMARKLNALAVAAVALTAVGVTPLVSSAAETPKPTVPGLDLAPGMLAAMRRDLKLDDTQIAARLRTEATAPVIEQRLRAELGTAYGGAWIPAGAGRLTVAVTDPAAASAVRAEGADPKVVGRG